MNSPIIDLRIECGIKRIKVYADSASERQLGLETLLSISPELQSIEAKLSASAGAKALGQS